MARLDEFVAQLYLGPIAPADNTVRSPSPVIAYQLRMLRSGQYFVFELLDGAARSLLSMVSPLSLNY